ncbi:hypothetical protein ACOSP7_018546 [Xanthoceras sorbifolium]
MKKPVCFWGPCNILKWPTLEVLHEHIETRLLLIEVAGHGVVAPPSLIQLPQTPPKTSHSPCNRRSRPSPKPEPAITPPRKLLLYSFFGIEFA